MQINRKLYRHTIHRARGWMRLSLGWMLVALLGTMGLAHGAVVTKACRVEGMANEPQCGSVKRAWDPARPDGVQVEVHFMVVPAMARNKQTDAVLMLAGGPGQSAISIAPAVMSRLSRLNHRRDLVFIDQRGTGRSAPLHCDDETRLPEEEMMDAQRQLQRLRACMQSLSALPHGDLRWYTTSTAVQDFEAVRQLLGVPQWNLIGASYGTRAAIEYQRQFPAQVRRMVLDGVAPPDMVLPESFSRDGQAALDQMFDACAKDATGDSACAVLYPRLRQEWQSLLDGLPRKVTVNHPVSGQAEAFTLTRAALLRAIRSPLYVPALAAGLPAAIHAGALGDFSGLVTLAGSVGARKSMRLAMGMHFSVVCSEDAPRMSSSNSLIGKDFGTVDAEQYTQVCGFWPHGDVAPAFYSVGPSQSPVLVLSGGADPATPPHHGDKVAKALGAKAQHIVVPQAGHGVMGVGCMGDVMVRFITASTDATALPQDASCALAIPRPGVFVPVQSTPTKGVQP